VVAFILVVLAVLFRYPAAVHLRCIMVPVSCFTMFLRIMLRTPLSRLLRPLLFPMYGPPYAPFSAALRPPPAAYKHFFVFYYNNTDILNNTELLFRGACWDFVR
jgi:hypothetical protein